MGDVLIDISASLDGFIAQSDDAPGPIHDWYFNGDVLNEQNPFFSTSAESAPVIAENLNQAGALICGRTTYDLTGGWDGNHPLGDIDCFVVTHEVPAEVPAGSTTFTFVTFGIEAAIDQAISAAGGDDVYIMGGASVIWQALAAGRVDRCHLHLAHVFIGAGVRLFDGMDEPNDQWPMGVTLARQIDAPGVSHLLFNVHAR